MDRQNGRTALRISNSKWLLRFSGKLVNTGGLLERMNFGLALASNRVQGTRVNSSSVTGNVNRTEVNKVKVMDESLRTILGGDVSATTRDALLKQMDQEMVVSLPGPRNQESPEMGGQGRMGPRPGAPGGQMDGPPGPPPGGFQVARSNNSSVRVSKRASTTR